MKSLNSVEKRQALRILGLLFLIAATSACFNENNMKQETSKAGKQQIKSAENDKTAIPSRFKPLYGVNAGPGAFWPDTKGPSYGFTDVTEQYKDIGVRTIRISDFFGAGDMMNYFPIEGTSIPDPNDPNNYYWTETDKQLAKIKEGGFDVHIRLGQSWRNMASWAPYKGMPLEGYQLNADQPINFWPNIAKISKELQPELFLEFLDHFLVQWNIPATEEVYVEFWNEPNIESINTVPTIALPDISDEEFLNTTFNNYEWDGTPLEFYQLYETCAKAIKKRYPNIKIGGPAIWNPEGGKGPIDAKNPFPFNQRWIHLFFDYVKANEVPMDFICWNVYADDPEAYKTAYTSVQGHLDRIGYKETTQIITEYAIRFDNKTTLSNGQQVSNTLLAKGAAIATSLWIGFQELPNLEMTYYNRGSDGPYIPNGAGFPIMVKKEADGIVNTSPNSFGTAGIGLLNGDGSYKPIAHAHKLWKQMADLVPISPDKYLTYNIPYRGELHLLAGERDEKKIVILGSFRNDFSNMKATLALPVNIKSAILKTILNDGVETIVIDNPRDLQNIWIQPNNAFQLTLILKT